MVLIERPASGAFVQVERIDVEESLSPLSMSFLEHSPLARSSLQLDEEEEQDERDSEQEGEKMKFSAQFQDFTNVDMSW